MRSSLRFAKFIFKFFSQNLFWFQGIDIKFIVGNISSFTISFSLQLSENTHWTTGCGLDLIANSIFGRSSGADEIEKPPGFSKFFGKKSTHWPGLNDGFRFVVWGSSITCRIVFVNCRTLVIRHAIWFDILDELFFLRWPTTLLKESRFSSDIIFIR